MKDVVLLSLSQYECDVSFRTEIHLWLRLVFSCDLVVLTLWTYTIATPISPLRSIPRSKIPNSSEEIDQFFGRNFSFFRGMKKFFRRINSYFGRIFHLLTG